MSYYVASKSPNKARQHRPLRELDLHSAASLLHYGRCLRR